MQKKNLYKYLIVLLVWGCLPILLQAQSMEICDNAIDDGGNGLIDLNDPSCDCQPPEPSSLIPNPFFEVTTCCPSDRAQLYCAETWIQASEATTDYFHNCGYFMRPEFPVPLPLPGGEAYIGFRNGRFTRNPNPNWKEYTGACLLSPLLDGVQYTFQFHIGFVNAVISPSMKVALYGTTDCANLPFGTGDREFGCPLNGPGWKKLGEVQVGGSQEWIQYDITTTPSEDLTVASDLQNTVEVNLHDGQQRVLSGDVAVVK